MPHLKRMSYEPLSHFVIAWSVLCCSCLLLLAITTQEQCRICSRFITKTSNRTHICLECRKQQEHKEEQASSVAAAASSPSTISPASPPSPFFDSPATLHSHLSVGQRWAIITLHKEGHDHSYISQRIPCDVKSVRRWIVHYEQHQTVEDDPRSGRPRITDEETDTAIAGTAYVEKFCTPRGLKRKYQFAPSTRTIDRRLQEAGLFGRVARHRKRLSEEEKRKRLSFAEGYLHMTKDEWMQVLFADEKLFKGEGFMGQVWVRRPIGEADNPEYCVNKLPHPVKLNVWGCFCGRGLGYCYIFNENMDGKLLKTILGTHLKESAELHYEQDPPELWRLLQDNDPKHKSTLVQTWLFNNGISMLDFPPYSPDLNPIENVWNDLARRVEAKPAGSMQQLQDTIADEWAATSVEFLRKLARSMPKRCKAVIDAKGDHTKY